MWKITLTTPIDILSHNMSKDTNRKELWCEIFSLILQADNDLQKTLTLMPSGQQTVVSTIRMYYALKEVLKRLRKDYLEQAQELIIHLVMSGYKPSKSTRQYIKDMDLGVYGWVLHYLSQPVSLRDQCVKVVRHSFKCNVFYGITHLKVLPHIKEDILQCKSTQPCLIWL